MMHEPGGSKGLAFFDDWLRVSSGACAADAAGLWRPNQGAPMALAERGLNSILLEHEKHGI